MTEVLNLTAAELQPGDVWLGEDGVELEVFQVTRQPEAAFVPWERGRNHPPVPMFPVVVTGRITRPDGPGYTGRWTLQPDMPLEVRRGAG